MRVRSSMGWLGGTVRRWFALMGGLATITGVVGFVATSGLPWAWLTIGALTLLVVSVGWTARDEHRARLALEGADAKHTLLARAIADGQALLGIEAQLRQYEEWMQWFNSVEAMLRVHVGLGAAHGFYTAGQAPGTRKAITAQVVYLEGLQ